MSRLWMYLPVSWSFAKDPCSTTWPSVPRAMMWSALGKRWTARDQFESHISSSSESIGTRLTGVGGEYHGCAVASEQSIFAKDTRKDDALGRLVQGAEDVVKDGYGLSSVDSTGDCLSGVR